MPRKREVDLDMLEEIEKLAIRGHSASQIHRQLEREHSHDLARVPSLRTVQRLYREILPPDPSGPWTLADCEPEDAQHVLAVLRFFPGTQRHPMVTKSLAKWIIRIAKAAPTLPYRWVFSIARAYQRTPGKTRDLDLFLAFRPWESQERSNSYNNYASAGVFAIPAAARPHSEPVVDWPADFGTREQEESIAPVLGTLTLRDWPNPDSKEASDGEG